MEIRVLRYFLAVAREQNITKAAGILNVSQPTLSTQMKELEEEIGKPLLVRGRKGSRKVTLTQEGMILRKRAEEIMNLVNKTRNELCCADGNLSGEIHIGMGETRNMLLFAEAASMLRDEHPDIRLDISSGNSRFVLEMLDKGLIDFGLLYDDVDSVKYETLEVPVSDRWGLLMKSDCPLARKETVSVRDLAGLPLIVSQQQNSEKILSGQTGLRSEEINIVARYNLVLNASFLTQAGLGCTLCYEGLVPSCAQSGLAFRPLDPPVTSTAVIVWKRFEVLSRLAEQYLAKLRLVFDACRQQNLKGAGECNDNTRSDRQDT